jgi:hypothetical protein
MGYHRPYWYINVINHIYIPQSVYGTRIVHRQPILWVLGLWKCVLGHFWPFLAYFYWKCAYVWALKNGLPQAILVYKCYKSYIHTPKSVWDPYSAQATHIMGVGTLEMLFQAIFDHFWLFLAYFYWKCAYFWTLKNGLTHAILVYKCYKSYVHTPKSVWDLYSAQATHITGVGTLEMLV